MKSERKKRGEMGREQYRDECFSREPETEMDSLQV